MTRRTTRSKAQTIANFRAAGTARGVQEVTLDTLEKQEAFWAAQGATMRARFGAPQMTDAERAMYAAIKETP